MNLLEAIKNHKKQVIKKGNFNLIIKDQNGDKISEFSGYFTKSGQSIYAHNKNFGLVAGSQTKDENEAKIKAIMRLVQMIAINVLHSNTEQLLKSSDTNLINFIKFVNKSGFIQLINDDSNIPVYTEQLKETENGYNYLFRRLKNTVTDLKYLQRTEYDSLSESEQIVEISAEKNIGNMEYVISTPNIISNVSN